MRTLVIFTLLQLNVAALRKLTADQLRQNKNDYQPFACHPDSGDMLSDGNVLLKKFL